MVRFRCSPWNAVMLAAIMLSPSASALRAQGGDQTQKPANPKPNATAPAKEAKEAKEQWLTDAEGRQYKLDPVPKAQAQKVSETQVRSVFGITMDLVREDEQFFYIKLYKTAPAPITKTPPVTPSRTRGAKPSPPPSSPPSPPTKGTGKGAGAAGAKPSEAPPPAASARLRWTAAGTGLPTKGQWREGLVLADLTGDGRLDIAASGARKTLRPPTIFTSDGTTWKSAGIKFEQRQFDYGDLALADIDGNGTLDAALGIHLRGLMAFRRDADGAFADASTGLPFAENSRAQSFSSRAVALTDCNADGRLDLVALGEGPRLPGPGVDAQIAMGLASFIQQADGSWQAAPPGEHAGLFGATLAIADVDGDKKLDAIVAPGTLGDSRLVLLGDGACGWKAETIDAVRPRSYITSVGAGDVTVMGTPMWWRGMWSSARTRRHLASTCWCAAPRGSGRGARSRARRDARASRRSRLAISMATGARMW